MDYEISDSSGTDDDLPPAHRSRFQAGACNPMNGRSEVGGPASPQREYDMETQIHAIEQEAYCGVLRAFKAQSDAITWEKETLITELRKELRVSDEEHRKLLAQVNSDDIIWKIREWRKAQALQPSMANVSLPSHDRMPSPTTSASCKKQKTSQPLSSLSKVAPSTALHSSILPSNSGARRGPPDGAKCNKIKSHPSTDLTGRTQVASRNSSDATPKREPVENKNYESLIGRKVWTRWPEDNHFYEAVITEYNREKGCHSLVYDRNTPNETREWVNLREISREDIRWEGGDPGIFHGGGRPRPGSGNKKSTLHDGGATITGRGRGTMKVQSKKDLSLLSNGARKKALGDIEILHTDTLIKEVEKVFNASRADPVEIEKAKKVLEEHEQSLINAIGRLKDAYDGESEGVHRKKRAHEEIGGGCE